MLRVSPGWVETEAAVALVNRLAEANGTDYTGAQKALMDLWAASRLDARRNRKKSRSLLPFSPHRAPGPSPAPNTSSTAALCRPLRTYNGQRRPLRVISRRREPLLMSALPPKSRHPAAPRGMSAKGQ